MLTSEINDIISKLLSTNPAFLCGLFYEPGKRNEMEFKGITDTIPAYFYISRDRNDEADNYDFERTDWNGCGSHQLTGRYKLIARFPCANLGAAVRILAVQLERCGAALKSASVESELIYFEETGQKMETRLDIMRINFELSSVLVPDCDPVTLCAENCC